MMDCDQCQMLSINGVLFMECRECGDEIEKGESCPCRRRYDEVDGLWDATQ